MKRRLLATATATAAALLISGAAAGSATANAPANARARADADATVVALAGTAAQVGPASVQVPDGVTAGAAVFDRQTGTFTEQLNTSLRFRSASVVKLLLALDFLWNRGPDYTVPAADRPGWSRCSAAAGTTRQITTGRRTAARRSSPVWPTVSA